MEKTVNIRAFKIAGYRFELTENAKGQPVARMEKMMKSGPNKGNYSRIEGYYFNTEEKREVWIKEKVAGIVSRMKEEADRKNAKSSARANMINPFKVGEIYYDSWGYDQTNIDFYQVVEVKAKSVVIREINGETVPDSATSWCSDKVRPVKDSFCSGPMVKPVIVSVGYSDPGKVSYHIKSRHGWISLYDDGKNGLHRSWGH